MSTMAALQPSELVPLIQDKHHSPLLAASFTSNSASDTTENHVYGAAQVETRAAAPTKPSIFYEIYHDPKIQLLSDQSCFKSDGDGYTCYPGVATGHAVLGENDQLQAGHRAATYKLAVRADRSNRAPLATIVEQGSYSTLNSHRSLLSFGRFTSIEAVEPTSPIRGAQRRSRSLDKNTLHDFQEDPTRKFNTLEVAVPKARLDGARNQAESTSATSTPTTVYCFETQSGPPGHSDEEMLEYGNGNVKGLMHGVLQNMRGVPGARSRSSSSTQVPVVDHRSRPISFSGSSFNPDQQGQSTEAAHLSKHSRYTLTQSSEEADVELALRNQTTSRATPSSKVNFSAQTYQRPTGIHSETPERRSNSGSDSPVLPCSAATCSFERFYSTSVVHPETRDVAQVDGTVPAQTCHPDISDTSAPCTFDGIPIHRSHVSSSGQMSSVRDIFTSQNASFCSTMSTSYSGTVLGVDLDLQHDFTRPLRRSQSPPTPIWFTPQMAELERLASSLESSKLERTLSPTQGPCHTITSSALSSLLPIAAATGIVHPNYNTPTISFYSPSGNPIQPESRSSPCESSLDCHVSPTTSTSYYNRHHTNVVASAQTRPPLVPMTTPPMQKAPLSLHLQHHHNYRHPEMSQICSHGSFYTPRGPVKGCDGFVREDSLTPRSGMLYSHKKDKVRRSTKLLVHDLKAEAKFYKARFLATAATRSFIPSLSQGKNLQKRLHDFKVHFGDSHGNNAKQKLNSDRFDSFVAHTLPVCFCQPHDGAGSWTRATVVRSCTTGKTSTVNKESKGDQRAKDVELLLPNARVINKQRHGSCGDTKRATKRDSALSTATGRASYTKKTGLKAA